MLRIFFLVSILVCVSSASAADEHQLAQGKAVYDKWCLICHGEENGSSGGGTMALRVLYKGALPAKLEDRTDMSAELVKAMVRQGRSGMPNFRYTEISPKELEMVIAYLTRNNKK